MSDTTIRVRVARGEFRYDREQYTQGDELDVHEGALEKHPRTLEHIEDEEESPEPDGDQVVDDEDEDETSDTDDELDEELTVADLEPHPSDLTVPELEERLEDVDEIALGETILEAEQTTDDPRSTAIDAIKARITELEG